MALIHPEDRDIMQRAFRRQLNEHQGTQAKFRIVRPDGEIRVLEGQGDTTYDETGQPRYISVAMMDVTEREAAFAREAELEHQLRHSEKLTALGTLAGGIAHDLNNTLVPIQALSKLALRELPEERQCARISRQSFRPASRRAISCGRSSLSAASRRSTRNSPISPGSCA